MTVLNIEFEVGDDNVFADLGFAPAEAEALSHKAELVGMLYRCQEQRGLNQSAFSRLVGIPQPRLSQLYGGKLAGVSTDKLLSAVAKVGAHVVIRVEQNPKTSLAGRVELEFA